MWTSTNTQPVTINTVPVACIVSASRQYHIPAPLLIAILKTENGRKGLARRNHNGTFDYGPMQINSYWLPKIKKFGYTAQDLKNNPCANVSVGAWILAESIANGHSLWRGVADYHSYTPKENRKYRVRVIRYYNAIESQLDQVS